MGEYLGGRFGAGTAILNDFNGDGYPDIAIGDNSYNPQTTSSGKLYVYSGHDQTLLFSKESTTYSGMGYGMGWDVASAGDFDKDGLDEVVVGFSNRAQVYTSGYASPIFNETGEQSTGCFGYSVSSAGDYDADGFGDIAIGDPCYDVNGIATTGMSDHTGKVYVYSGKDKSLLASYLGPIAGAGFGFTLAQGFDLNFDGRDDLIIGARFYGVFVYSGASHGLLWSKIDSEMAHDVASIGDFNGDGYFDVAVGTRGGKASVLSGLDGSQLFSYQGELPMETQVGSAGDYDSDGYQDLIVGRQDGLVIVFSGKNKTALSLIYDPNFAGENRVTGGADFNDDGKADLVISGLGTLHPTPGKPGGQKTGAIFVYSKE